MRGRAIAGIAIAGALAACANVAPTTTATGSAGPDPTSTASAASEPTPSTSPGPGEIAALLRENIDRAYRQQHPQPGWLRFYNGLTVDAVGRAHVYMAQFLVDGGPPPEGAPPVAKKMCRAIAAVALNADGQRIGVTSIHVPYGYTFGPAPSADCRVIPERP